MKPFQHPHPEEATRHPVEPLVFPFHFPHEKHQPHEDGRQPAQRLQGGVERQIDPRVTWPKKVGDQAVQPRGGDQTDQNEWLNHGTARTRMRRGHYDGVERRVKRRG